ncbi:thiol-disulfide oxidoreductase : Redoxin domain protein OS=Planctomyces brasiliensis (strain ATCC 49424 / DSM 5305 / JCM 21570 / NBRC 103401 / IFAM 1448) GN=Plabr_3782 PE=4 SV=1: Redoxin: Cu2_monoox_C [Gemmataceae bacterium]|nr:thiol-disulfide oxidoreductase : Redoxin domain protein OS=Planctomyces brasiliensis (strain ATCC 49424 / DSM 5305 / JCM 21570 / NBRC 103401 / IFAM 1448) GN=Plabr_3782 PE=4 SV=1: Redoxin: Cu2_monoox_C [Gemmataceae bacterium]VTT96356.1 thiol-disulfide oxidoreductase : Redoxin domain protein OS=Planctomyces brasiliensis (strain ATCC 49424 / DSM 5305 / JCM 21570 / NBRC 103401 / IFAM 1448) GN=Plabr_3782 PE=4 SV=1: Redoxin: Cu2_monoox_C [Gemmataceae bacterium]
MRLLALALTVSVGVAAAQEPPKKNPFRDGSGSGTSETPAATPAAKPDPVRNAPRVLRAAEAGVGKLVADVAFTDLAGKSGKLSDFKAAKLTVVAFTNTTCPLCKKYAPVLARTEKEYAAKGVAFLFVNPTATDKPDGSAFTGRYVHDTDGKLTAALGANSTTEVVVLDAARTVVYRGAIDDQYGLGYSLDAPRNKYLATALDEALAGKSPVVAGTTAPGCALDADAMKAPAVALTYHARIERIVQANCVECHRSGGVGPFSLDSYDDVVAHKGAIKKVVDNGTMPPWFAAHAKAGHSPFANDRSLTDADKKDLLAFLGGDLKKGDPADAPLPRKYDSGWLIGKPDATFQLPKPVAVKAEGVMGYQHIKVETNFDEDRWVQAIEVQPTAREVTHHVLVFATARGARLGGGEAAGFFAVYVPGNNSLVYPDGYAKKLPKGATLHFQMHYTPNGKATTDQTKLGLIFAKHPPRHEVQVAGIVNTRFEIPPGEGNHRVDAKIPVPFDAKVLALFPHAHLRGKAAKYELNTPDGKTSTLLDVPHYDFNWQLQYRFADPVTAPRGSSLTYTAWYDNSDKNPANPDPKKTVRWGQQTYEEMHLGYIEFVRDTK